MLTDERNVPIKWSSDSPDTFVLFRTQYSCSVFLCYLFPLCLFFSQLQFFYKLLSFVFFFLCIVYLCIILSLCTHYFVFLFWFIFYYLWYSLLCGWKPIFSCSVNPCAIPHIRSGLSCNRDKLAVLYIAYLLLVY